MIDEVRDRDQPQWTLEVWFDGELRIRSHHATDKGAKQFAAKTWKVQKKNPRLWFVIRDPAGNEKAQSTMGALSLRWVQVS